MNKMGCYAKASPLSLYPVTMYNMDCYDINMDSYSIVHWALRICIILIVTYNYFLIRFLVYVIKFDIRFVIVWLSVK